VELYAELSEVTESLFDIRYDTIKATTRAPKKVEIDSLNAVGLKSIDYAQRALALLEVKAEFVPTVVSLTLTTARIYSKLFDKEQGVQIAYLEKSIGQYKAARNSAGKKPTEDIKQMMAAAEEQLRQVQTKLGKLQRFQ